MIKVGVIMEIEIYGKKLNLIQLLSNLLYLGPENKF